MPVQRYVLHAKDPARAGVLAHLHEFLERLPDTKSYTVELRLFYKSRTLPQGSALFGVAYDAIMEACGLRGKKDKEYLHQFFCEQFFGTVETPYGGKRARRTTTTNERGEKELIDTRTMSEMYAFIQQYMAERGIDVPDPDPLWYQGDRP